MVICEDRRQNKKKSFFTPNEKVGYIKPYLIRQQNFPTNINSPQCHTWARGIDKGFVGLK